MAPTLQPSWIRTIVFLCFVPFSQSKLDSELLILFSVQIINLSFWGLNPCKIVLNGANCSSVLATQQPRVHTEFSSDASQVSFSLVILLFESLVEPRNLCWGWKPSAWDSVSSEIWSLSSSLECVMFSSSELFSSEYSILFYLWFLSTLLSLSLSIKDLPPLSLWVSVPFHQWARAFIKDREIYLLAFRSFCFLFCKKSEGKKKQKAWLAVPAWKEKAMENYIK